MRKKNSGAILIVSLIILIALTLFVLSANQTVIIQEKMTAAMRDVHVSLEIAESGVLDAEAYIETLSDTSTFNDTGSGGLYSKDNGPSDLFADAIWENDVIRIATTEVSDDSIVARYFIEEMGDVSVGEDDDSLAISTYGDITDMSHYEVFKIVSSSMGRSGDTERIIVSYYAKTF